MINALAKTLGIPGNLLVLDGTMNFQATFNADGSLRLRHPEIRVDLLTPDKRRISLGSQRVNNSVVEDMLLGVLKSLFKDQITVIRKGRRTSVPNPTAFAVHKLLLAVRKKNPFKIYQEVAQALILLGSVPPQELFDLPGPVRKQMISALKKAQKDFPILGLMTYPMITAIQRR